MKIKINGTYFEHFNNISIGLTLDKLASVFSFSAYFDPNNKTHKELFKPLSYPNIEIYSDNDELLLTGVIVSHNLKSSSKPSLINVSGYSLAGILEDVTIPLKSYPLESLNMTAEEITDKFISPFGLRLVVDSSVSREATTLIEKSVASATESIKSYISKITSQKNIVLSHNQFGNMVFFKPSTTSSPVYFFNKENTLEMGLSTNGQRMHSELSIIRQPSPRTKKSHLRDTVENNLVNSYRPSVSVLTSGETTATTTAANNKLASELSSVSLNLSFDKYIKLSPGDIVEVQNEEVYLYSKTRFMVSSIVITENDKQYKTSINLVLPESFSGEAPKNIFNV